MAERGVKVALTSPDGDVETLWAKVVGDRAYELDNVPWYAYRLSLGDIVEASGDENAILEYERTITKSGNRTIRVILSLTDESREWTVESRELVERLKKIGVGYEGANKAFLGLNIPPPVDLQAVAAILTETGVDWEYADPTYEDLFPTETESADEREG
jgi:hypothetical protein